MFIQTIISLAVIAFAATDLTPESIREHDLKQTVLELQQRYIVPTCGSCHADYLTPSQEPNVHILSHTFSGGGSEEEDMLAQVGGPSDITDLPVRDALQQGASFPILFVESVNMKCEGSENAGCHGDWRQGHCGDTHDTCPGETESALLLAEGASMENNVQVLLATMKGNSKLRMSENSRFVQVLDCKRMIVAQFELQPTVTEQIARLRAE